MEKENNTPKTNVFAMKAILFQNKLQDFIIEFFNCFTNPKPLMFNKPFLSCIDGGMEQVDGLVKTKNGRVKPIINGWNISETPSIASLDITTLVRIADIINDWKYRFEKE